MRNAFFPSLVLILCRIAAAGQATTTDPSESIRFSCLDSRFLRVSAHVPKHDRFPDVELQLTDELGQQAGDGKYNRRIPHSQYGRITELPKMPNRSKAVAVEVCDAKPGRYLFSVSEHGNAPYRISVTGGDGTSSNTGNETQIIYRQPSGDRGCRFSFDFFLTDGKVTIRWLDKEKHPLPFAVPPDCDPVPRA
jgi:hypothetical protein